MGISETFEPEHRGVRRNRKRGERDDRTGIDLFDHGMDGRAEIRHLIVERKMRRRPSGISWRPRMEVESAVTDQSQNRLRYDHRCHEGDQPRTLQHRFAQASQFARALDRQNGEAGVMSEQRRRQNRSFDRAGQEDNGIEHELFVRIFAADAVLRESLRSDGDIFPEGAPIWQKRTCCTVLRLRRRKYLETKKWRSGVDLTGRGFMMAPVPPNILVVEDDRETR